MVARASRLRIPKIKLVAWASLPVNHLNHQHRQGRPCYQRKIAAAKTYYGSEVDKVTFVYPRLLTSYETETIEMLGIGLDQFINPHVQIRFDGKDENGNVTSWTAESGSPQRLFRVGWGKTTLKSGDQITVTGPARSQ